MCCSELSNPRLLLISLLHWGFFTERTWHRWSGWSSWAVESCLEVGKWKVKKYIYIFIWSVLPKSAIKPWRMVECLNRKLFWFSFFLPFPGLNTFHSFLKNICPEGKSMWLWVWFQCLLLWARLLPSWPLSALCQLWLLLNAHPYSTRSDLSPRSFITFRSASRALAWPPIDPLVNSFGVGLCLIPSWLHQQQGALLAAYSRYALSILSPTKVL